MAHGIDAFASIQPGPCTLQESMAQAQAWLARAAENAMRQLRVGARSGPERAASQGASATSPSHWAKAVASGCSLM